MRGMWHEIDSMAIAGFEKREAKEYVLLLESGKGKETNSSLYPTERNTVNTLILA